MAGVFKSLSDPTRLRIISLLAEQELCVTDLTAALEMEQSTISHQLRDMRAQRLVYRHLAQPAPFAFPLLVERLREALEKIATVNAMDYEYVRWAKAALRREEV